MLELMEINLILGLSAAWKSHILSVSAQVHHEVSCREWVSLNLLLRNVTLV